MVGPSGVLSAVLHAVDPVVAPCVRAVTPTRTCSGLFPPCSLLLLDPAPPCFMTLVPRPRPPPLPPVPLFFVSRADPGPLPNGTPRCPCTPPFFPFWALPSRPPAGWCSLACPVQRPLRPWPVSHSCTLPVAPRPSHRGLPFLIVPPACFTRRSPPPPSISLPFSLPRCHPLPPDSLLVVYTFCPYPSPVLRLPLAWPRLAPCVRFVFCVGPHPSLRS